MVFWKVQATTIFVLALGRDLQNKDTLEVILQRARTSLMHGWSEDMSTFKISTNEKAKKNIKGGLWWFMGQFTEVRVLTDGPRLDGQENSKCSSAVLTL